MLDATVIVHAVVRPLPQSSRNALARIVRVRKDAL
jgi:hypothetical protein